MDPVSSTNTPDERLIFPGRVSFRNVSARPRIGSGGAGMRASDGSDTVDLDEAVRGAEATLPETAANLTGRAASRLPRRTPAPEDELPA